MLATVVNVDIGTRDFGMASYEGELSLTIRGSEDFGHYAKEVPAAYFYIGNGMDHPPIHTSEYDFIDEHIKTECNVFKALANV